MRNFEDNPKPNRKKNFPHKKVNKKFIDEDQFFQKKLTKEFKYKKKNMIDDDDDWKNWNNERPE